jgi:hypothetical protein
MFYFLIWTVLVRRSFLASSSCRTSLPQLPQAQLQAGTTLENRAFPRRRKVPQDPSASGYVQGMMGLRHHMRPSADRRWFTPRRARSAEWQEWQLLFPCTYVCGKKSHESSDRFSHRLMIDFRPHMGPSADRLWFVHAYKSETGRVTGMTK